MLILAPIVRDAHDGTPSGSFTYHGIQGQEVVPMGQFLEHRRLAQEDILEFMTNPRYRERSWPADYWPSRAARATPVQWQETIYR
jgi:hypothetical protein